MKLAYVASYAQQQERGANPFKIDNHYSLLELDATWKQYTLGVGDEVLSGYLVPGTTTTVGFSTPLATLHKFQGWADKFLTTPGNGIDDRYATLTWTKKGVTVAGHAGASPAPGTATTRSASAATMATN